MRRRESKRKGSKGERRKMEAERQIEGDGSKEGKGRLGVVRRRQGRGREGEMGRRTEENSGEQGRGTSRRL